MMRAEPERGTPLGMFEREGEEAPDVRELWAAARVGGKSVTEYGVLLLLLLVASQGFEVVPSLFGFIFLSVSPT